MIMRALGPDEAAAINYQLRNLLAVLDPVLSDALDMGDGLTQSFVSRLREATQLAEQIATRDRPACPHARRPRGVILTKK